MNQYDSLKQSKCRSESLIFCILVTPMIPVTSVMFHIFVTHLYDLRVIFVIFALIVKPVICMKAVISVIPHDA